MSNELHETEGYHVFTAELAKQLDPKSSIESLAKALMIRPTKAFPPAVNSAI